MMRRGQKFAGFVCEFRPRSGKSGESGDEDAEPIHGLFLIGTECLHGVDGGGGARGAGRLRGPQRRTDDQAYERSFAGTASDANAELLLTERDAPSDGSVGLGPLSKAFWSGDAILSSHYGVTGSMR
jgi:hypothetical protein